MISYRSVAQYEFHIYQHGFNPNSEPVKQRLRAKASGLRNSKATDAALIPSVARPKGVRPLAPVRTNGDSTRAVWGRRKLQCEGPRTGAASGTSQRLQVGDSIGL